MTLIYYLFFVIVFMTIGMFLFLILFWSIENLYNSFKEYFFPTPQLPYEIMEEIYQEASEVVWNMHRVGDEPDFGEYIGFVDYLHAKKYAEYFG